MGVTFEGIYVPGTPIADVTATVRRELLAIGATEATGEPGVPPPSGMRRIKLFLHQAASGVAEVAGLLEERALDLAKALSVAHGAALAAGVEDGELWHYTLFGKGEIVDRYLSIADLAGDEADQVRGNPAAVARHWPGAAAARLTEVLAAESNHAECVLADFLEELGIPGALELPQDGVTRLQLLVPQAEALADADEPSLEDQEEAVKAMLGAAGVDDARGKRYLELMTRYEKMLESAGSLGGAASLESLAGRLSGNAEFKAVARELIDMRQELTAGLERTMEEVSRKDPRIAAAMERSKRAGSIEADAAAATDLLRTRPRDGLRKLAAILDDLLEQSLGTAPGRGTDDARSIDHLVGTLRERDRALVRDLGDALPALVGGFVADCLLREPGVDLVRLPETGQVRLRRGTREEDPFAWVAEALSRREPRPLGPRIDAFLGPSS